MNHNQGRMRSRALGQIDQSVRDAVAAGEADWLLCADHGSKGNHRNENGTRQKAKSFH
jgi:hypothetical protein